jgi:preprotein translocase subunit SecG
MLQGLLSFFFSLSCIFLILLILVQKGKSSLGIGALGGGSQTLFGSTGGQDLFQKITWILGAILIGGSLGLAILKSKQAPSLYRAPIAQQLPEN